MKKVMTLVGALLVSLASHAIWFHTSCGYSTYRECSSVEEALAYMEWLESVYCEDVNDHDGEFPE